MSRTGRLDGERAQFIGEVGGVRKQELFARAAALLMPIRWPEPFGMVMIEALACGTPVIAFPEGAASEIVVHGDNGFLVEDEVEMADAIARLAELDPGRCRASAARYAADGIAAEYEAVYRELASRVPSGGRAAGDLEVQPGQPVAAPGVARRRGDPAHAAASTAGAT